MNNDILVGKIVNTFGIKGEVKILSNFEFKERVFKMTDKIIKFMIILQWLDY